MQKLLRGFNLLRRGYAHAVQRVRDTEVLPLEQSQRVVGQNFYAAHGGQRFNKGIQLPQAVGVIGQAGSQNPLKSKKRTLFLSAKIFVDILVIVNKIILHF